MKIITGTIFLVLSLAISPTVAAAQTGGPVVPTFADESANSGVDTVYSGEWQYMVGGGAASFDCNDDGFAELFIAGGEGRAALWQNISRKGGDLRFSRADSGLEIEAVTGAWPLDVDGDGITDLAITRIGENLLMRGRGQCRFERANEAWGFDGGDGWSAAFAATFEKGSSWPTLAVGNYIDRAQELEPWGSCTDNWLHRPLSGDRPSDRRFAPPLPLKPSFCPLSMLFTDWSRSGRPDLRVSNDREYYMGGQEQLWRMEPGQRPRLFSEQEGWQNLRVWGMGIAGYDLDFDGLPEYFLTSMADNKLQKLKKGTSGGSASPTYDDVAYKRGVTAHRPFTGEDLRPSTAWHVQFDDINNDGLADIFIAKGNVAKMPDFAAADPNNLLVQKADGSFEETADRAGVASGMISRGAVIEDFNLDGKLDLAVVNRWTPVQIWRNTTGENGNWISLRLRQDGANRDAIGAWIEVDDGTRVQRRELTVGGGHASGQLGWRHFGLGSAGEATVRVQWPDGEAGLPISLKANNFAIIERNAKDAQYWVPQ